MKHSNRLIEEHLIKGQLQSWSMFGETNMGWYSMEGLEIMDDWYHLVPAGVREGQFTCKKAERGPVWRSDRSCGFNKETEPSHSNLAKGIISTTKRVTQSSLLDFTWCLTKVRGQGACPSWSASQSTRQSSKYIHKCTWKISVISVRRSLMGWRMGENVKELVY